MEPELLEQARSLFTTIQLLRRVLGYRHAMQVSSACGGADLTMAQMHALMAIHGCGQVSIKELAESLHVSAPSASTMVDRLVEAGMVSREQSQADRRGVVIQLSQQGKEGIQELEQTVLQFLAEIMEKIGPEYTAQWCQVYERIREVVAESDEANVSESQQEK